ncbi:MAG: hypothetical protein ACYCW6_09435 [Candidatus Xenobia bacterium]
MRHISASQSFAPRATSRPASERMDEENISRANLVSGLSGQELQHYQDLAAPFAGPDSYQSELSDLSQHIYHPYRLQTINPDIQVSGTVDRVKAEPDGDLHVDLRLDPQYQGLTNAKNDQYQHGDLVTEVVYAGPVSQSDAQDAGQGFQNPVDTSALVKGAHVSMVGSYAFDRAHGWMELHPVANVQQQ